MSFKYFDASSLGEAVSLLRGEKGHVIAGGTDLLRLARDGVLEPTALVNVRNVSEMKKMEERGGNIYIGASVTLREIERSRLINERFPMLAEAARLVATPQIRNMGTVGGNLLQDVQCWYHRNTRFECLRRDGKSCPVPAGEHKMYYAITSAAGCFAVVPSDLAPPLAALGAKVRVVGANGERVIPVEELYLAKAPWRAVGQDEILSAVEVPLRRLKGKFIKHRILRSHTFAIANVAAALEMDGSICKDIRVFLGSIAPVLYRAARVEEALKGKAIREDLVEKAVEAMAQGFTLSRMDPWKAKVAKVICKRAILEAAS